MKEARRREEEIKEGGMKEGKGKNKRVRKEE